MGPAHTPGEETSPPTLMKRDLCPQWPDDSYSASPRACGHAGLVPGALTPASSISHTAVQLLACRSAVGVERAGAWLRTGLFAESLVEAVG